ncbi:hypothetical protein [Natronincola ferrireducens]|uniref:Uncharacterized protein n=1 Tax=Natronincola ferrireducens TaxID=393762 RepID=A0A1G9IDZ3_9FIRM|nr:hypothetical protein [Natronincola ferrireducens]SDL23429.1 hypothetical protein SAMN05660472_02842 [Natronincola ferrireducens]
MEGLLMLVMICLGLGIVFLFINKSRQEQKGKSEKLEQGIYGEMRAIHLYGLKYPPNVVFNVKLYSDYLLFAYENEQVKLNVKKIKSASVENVKEINESKGFSIGNAALGGILFGQVGAAIGGFSGSQNLKFKLLIINYIDSEGMLKHISFMPDYFLNVTNKSMTDYRNKFLSEFYNELKKKIDEISEHKAIQLEEL